MFPLGSDLSFRISIGTFFLMKIATPLDWEEKLLKNT